jgi:hypothetical protein
MVGMQNSECRIQKGSKRAILVQVAKMFLRAGDSAEVLYWQLFAVTQATES